MNLGHLLLLLALSLVGLAVQLGAVILSEELGRRWSWYKAHEAVYFAGLQALVLFLFALGVFLLGGWLS